MYQNTTAADFFYYSSAIILANLVIIAFYHINYHMNKRPKYRK